MHCRKIIVSSWTSPTSPRSGGAAASLPPGCSISRPSALAAARRSKPIPGFVKDSGEGRWTINAAIDEAVPAEVLTAALFARFRSRQQHTFAEKILSAMRKGFGGHEEPGEANSSAAKGTAGAKRKAVS